MKSIQNNLHYFNISKSHPEDLLDDFYIFDEKHPELSAYVEQTKEIKHILITIRTLQRKGEKESFIDTYFLELSALLGSFSNCSEFACFVNACDNTIKDVTNNIDTLKRITKRYFAKRMLNEVVPEEWIQAILDTNSARKKGACGEKKLVQMLARRGFVDVFDWNGFSQHEYCVLRFSKKINLKNVRKNLGVDIKTKKQNKTLDIIIKAEKRILLCEAKHLNTSGGAQDKQISELIEVVGLHEDNGASYISFLDGNYSNVLLSDNGGGQKIETQRREIVRCLEHYSKNYWVNTAGFDALTADLSSN